MTKDISHIYWFAYFDLQSASVRYRGKYPLDYFKREHQIDSTLIIPSYSPRNLFHFLVVYGKVLFFAKKEDLIVIQRVQSRFIYAQLLKILVLRHPDKTVYDLDDADYLLPNPKTILFFLKRCRWISAGSEEIRKFSHALNPHVLHISSPVWDLHIRKSSRNKELHVGWIGDFGGDHQLALEQLLFPALRSVPFPLQVSLIGVKTEQDQLTIRHSLQHNPFLRIDFIPIENWTDEPKIQEHIRTFDVGIATLLPTPIQLAKSGIKAKQYLNNGVPVIATNLPENARFVHHGVNGFLAENSQDFLKYLTEFQEMSDSHYQAFTDAAWDSKSNFDHERYYQQFRQLTSRAPYPLKVIKSRSKNVYQTQAN